LYYKYLPNTYYDSLFINYDNKDSLQINVIKILFGINIISEQFQIINNIITSPIDALLILSFMIAKIFYHSMLNDNSKKRLYANVVNMFFSQENNERKKALIDDIYIDFTINSSVENMFMIAVACKMILDLNNTHNLNLSIVNTENSEKLIKLYIEKTTGEFADNYKYKQYENNISKHIQYVIE
jgi:hypothetical protein